MDNDDTFISKLFCGLSCICHFPSFVKIRKRKKNIQHTIEGHSDDDNSTEEVSNICYLILQHII